MTNLRLKQRIYNWCKQEGIFKEEIIDRTTTFHFRIFASKTYAGNQEGNYNMISVIQPKGKDDTIIILSGIKFLEDFISPMKNFTHKEDIISNLKFVLENRPGSYGIEYSDGILRSVLIFEEIYSDGLIKDRLMTAIKEVNKSLFAALWMIKPLIEELELESGQKINKGLSEQLKSFGEPRALEELATEKAEKEAQKKAINGSVEVFSFCPNCGKKNKRKGRFCSNCGFTVIKKNIM